MRIGLYIFIFSVLCQPTSFAGCLNPEQVVGSGDFVADECSFHTVTHALFEDPRVSDGSIQIKKSSTLSLLSVNKMKGTARIYSLPKDSFGVVIKGHFEGEKESVSAFLKTSNSNYCDRFIKRVKINIAIMKVCCDCAACVEPPCSLGINNFVKRIEDKN